MTETSADWVERPKPADVAALSTRPVPAPKVRRERTAWESGSTPDLRVVAGVVGAVLLAVVLKRLSSR